MRAKPMGIIRHLIVLSWLFVLTPSGAFASNFSGFAEALFMGLGLTLLFILTVIVLGITLHLGADPEKGFLYRARALFIYFAYLSGAFGAFFLGQLGFSTINQTSSFADFLGVVLVIIPLAFGVYSVNYCHRAVRKGDVAPYLGRIKKLLILYPVLLFIIILAGAALDSVINPPVPEE